VSEWIGVVGQPITLCLQTQVEVELGCENNFEKTEDNHNGRKTQLKVKD
jgi:hypothetical protein